ncbi:MAG: amidohydrolase [Candidatus Aminicenantes bacterium]|nr:amidohydrolase [Candidatus Aminicenantes bacterium]
MLEELRLEMEAMAGRIIGRRRDFHRRPETAHNEFATSAALRDFFLKTGLSVAAMAGTGLRAVLDGRPGGRTVALRTDIDALPLAEEGDKEYASTTPGACHACGHDGHMAVLQAAAEALARRKDRFRGRVVFLCQPAEELPPGGAKPMIEAGALDGVEAIFGLHLWQPMPTGTVGAVRGPMMAQSDNFRITVAGRGGHASMPHQAVDPILAAAAVVSALQSVVSRNVDPLQPAVLSFGTIRGGTVYNIIPGAVELSGTVRTFDPDVQALMKRRLVEIARTTAGSFGAEAEVEYEDGYPPLVNDAAETDFALAVAARLFGGKSVVPIRPVMGGEDFAYYLREVPGAFLFFGAGDGTRFPHHHPGFDLDEKALPSAAALLAGLALEYLARPG